MDPNLNDILNEVPRLLQSFKSLAAVKEGIKYSCNEKDLTFYPSGGPVVEWVGSGWLSSWTQAATRTVNNAVFESKESHETLAANILKLKKNAELLATKISSVASDTFTNIEAKKALELDLIEMKLCAKRAMEKIDVLKETYKQEKEKSRVFSNAKDDYGKLIGSLEIHIQKVSQNIKIQGGNDLQESAQNARGTNRKYVPFSPLPDNITDADILEIRGYLTENAAIFDKMKERQLKRNPDCNAVFLKKEIAKLPASVHYISLAEFYLHIKEPSSLPGVRQILRTSDKKVFLYVKRKLDAEIDQSDNELKYLNVLKDDREFITVEQAFKYLSKNQSKRAFILKEECMATLDQAVEKMKFTDQQKYQITLDILHGVQIMHDKGIVHLNFKPENIFLVKENLGGNAGNKISAKIFGLEAARPCENESTYNKALDIWMVGHLLYYLFFQTRTDWLTFLINQTIFDIICIENAYESKIFSDKPSGPSIDLLIWSMLQSNPELRPSVSNAIEYVEMLLSKDAKMNELIDRRRRKVQEL